MSHRNKLLKRLKTDTFLKKINNESIRKDIIYTILSCVDKRVFNKITQNEMTKLCGVSLATIKRFESLKCESLELYLLYIHFLADLPNKKKIKIPNWV